VIVVYNSRTSSLSVFWSGDSLAAIGGIDEDNSVEPFRSRLLVPAESHRASNSQEREMLRSSKFPVKLECHTVRIGSYLLSVSRSLGHSYLPYEPGVSHTKVANEEQVLIVASDGIWDFVEHEQALQIAVGFEDPMEAARELVQVALDKANASDAHSSDNTTAVVLFLDT